MSGEVFVDTNVLVYQFDRSEPQVRTLAREWIETIWAKRAGRVSVQVLQELYNTITRKLSDPVHRDAARDAIRELNLWDPILLNRDVLEAAFEIEDRNGLSWWDALIVSAAQAAGCKYLLTEDLHHGQIFGGVKVVDFKLVTPDQLLID